MNPLSGRREKSVDKIDREAHALARKIGRDRRELIKRRKWAIETACICANEMTTAARIELARLIDAYVHEGEAA